MIPAMGISFQGREEKWMADSHNVKDCPGTNKNRKMLVAWIKEKSRGD